MSNQGTASLAKSTPLSAQEDGHQIVERMLCVNITGNLANLAMAGPEAAIWSVVSGKEGAAFSPHLNAEADPVATTNALRAVHLVRATLQEQYSTFPCTLGMTINCVPTSEVTDPGEKYAFTVLPFSRNTTPHDFYTELGADADTSSWRQMYSQWNPTNLETEGVMEVNNQPFVFVNMKHPVVGLLRHNAEMIGCNIDTQPVIDGEWYKLTRQVLSTCCNTLRSKVLSKVQTHDLNMLKVQAHRLDASAWDDLGDGSVALQTFNPQATWTAAELDLHKEHHLQQFVTTPYTYTARIKLVYKVPSAA